MTHFLELGIFSDRQFQIARKLAYDKGITKQKIAESFGVEESTIIELCKRLKLNAETFFHKKFVNVSDVAMYLKKEGLL